MLKADFHVHTADDYSDSISYSSEMVIDSAASMGFDVLALISHDVFYESERLREYALRKGILLIYGVEREIAGKHVLILNPDKEQQEVNSFESLRKVRGRTEVVIAPHPFYPSMSCLWKELYNNLDLFDAVEFCSMYFRFFNVFNWVATRIAHRYNLPIVGTTDAHIWPYKGQTYSLVDAPKTITGVLDAIRKGHVQLRTSPMTIMDAARMLLRPDAKWDKNEFLINKEESTS